MQRSTPSPILPRVGNPILVLLVCATVIATTMAFRPVSGWAGLLTGGIFGAQLSLGALFFMAIYVATGSKWWNPVRRHFLAVASTLYVPIGVCLVVALVGGTVLYPWAAPGAAEHSHLLHEKAAWLNLPFFRLRAVIVAIIFFTVLGLFGKALNRVINKPTEASKASLVHTAAISIMVLALSMSVGFWDWVMSLEPEWFSTMFGVYGFAGALQGGVAATVAVSLYTAQKDPKRAMSRATQHDFGKFLFAFSFFWAYIWFCQYMLIWYANLPEEVPHYIARVHGSWGFLFWLNPILNFIIPFFVLLPERTKLHRPTLFQVAMVVLLGRVLDVYLMIEPSLSPEMQVPFAHIASVIGVIVGMILWARRGQAGATPQSAVVAGKTARAAG